MYPNQIGDKLGDKDMQAHILCIHVTRESSINASLDLIIISSD
jgi:hypothetical protein